VFLSNAEDQREKGLSKRLVRTASTDTQQAQNGSGGEGRADRNFDGTSQILFFFFGTVAEKLVVSESFRALLGGDPV